MSHVTQLASDLIRFPTVSRSSNDDATASVALWLDEMGFQVEMVSYIDSAGVSKSNVVARRGPGEGGLAYFAHIDVVPGDPWNGPGDGGPFTPYMDSGKLFGRGACDMKGSLAAMLAAAKEVSSSEQHSPLWIVITADEEVGFDGARQVVAGSELYEAMRAEQPVSIIGEPTSLEVVHAHKGIRGFEVTSQGRAAHSSTRDGENAVLPMIPMLVELNRIYERTESDPSLMDQRFDPPTLSWNIGLSGGSKATNVTPATCTAWVCLRPMPGISGDDLVAQVESKADELGLQFKRFLGCGPLWVDSDSKLVRDMLNLTGTTAAKTVCYGTDGGIFHEMNQMVICGPGNIQQAHTSDEWICLDQLERGVGLYRDAIRRWCC